MDIVQIYIPIKQYKSDYNGLLHFDAIAADEWTSNFWESLILEEDLFRLSISTKTIQCKGVKSSILLCFFSLIVQLES